MLLRSRALGTAFAGSPPDLINCQGVLRNASDRPLNGSYDMVFSSYDGDVGSDETLLLVDSHTSAGTLRATSERARRRAEP